MNGVVLLVGGLLLVAVIKLIMDRNWIGLLLCAVALLLVFGAGHHEHTANCLHPQTGHHDPG